MGTIFESIFEIAYLISVIALGIIMIIKSKKRMVPLLFGISAIVLGGGDAFHLVPRIMYGLDWVVSSEVVEAANLGRGTLITSITMTVFYVLIYYVWKLRYKAENTKNLTVVVYALAAIRIALCCFPQNMWTAIDSPLSWGIYRNIPFLILGIIIIVLFFRSARKNQDKNFKYMWFAILLSFAFYTPVVLFASTYSWVGIFMLPKTVCYVWMVVMGYKTLKETTAIQKD